MKKILFISFILVFSSSCKDVVAEPFGNTYYFESPQPINDSELTSIPSKFQGIFMTSDSSYLNIKKNIILEEIYSRSNVRKEELDSLKNDFELVDDQYIVKSTKQIFNTRTLKDSIELRTKNVDTFFILSNTQKIKRINEHLILNEKDSIFWRIKIISLLKSNLTIKQIYSEPDLKKMDSLSKIKSKKLNSISFIINPSRREFKRFLDLKKFGHEQQFKKVFK